MDNDKQSPLDVAIIGGGPAGISGALTISRFSNLTVALFESEPQLGGIPRSCRNFFGLRDRKRIYTGPAYAATLDKLIRKTSVQIHLQSKVLKIIPGKRGELHRIEAVTARGIKSYETRFVFLATGCFESSSGARLIPGTRPSGLLTARTLQAICNIWHKKPGKRALIIGSEHVAFSCVLTLRKAGAAVVGLIENDPYLQTYSTVARAMSSFYGFPIYKSTSIKAILGNERIEEVEVLQEENQKVFKIDCDTVVIPGKFRPDSALIDNSPIEKDPLTLGPLIDANYMTSAPNIFAAGNILRGAYAHDLCALEGVKAATSIIRRLKLKESDQEENIAIQAESPIRYVVPQKIFTNFTDPYLLSRHHPGCSIQLKYTINNPIMEAWSGDEVIWKKSFRKLIGNTRVFIPVKKFDWHRLDKTKGIRLRLHGTSS